MKLEWLDGRFAICRLEAGAAVPTWLDRDAAFVSITRSDRELSIVAPEAIVPQEAEAERGWKAFRVAGTLEFSEVGVLAKLTGALAAAGVPVFAVSTYETDYLLVKEANVGAAREALTRED